MISAAVLPVDHADALLAGRLWLDGGPTVVLIRDGLVEDVSTTAPTMSDLLDIEDIAGVRGRTLFVLEELFNLPAECLLAPVDLQVIKAAGVTFAISAIERVIEERARGDYQAAAAIRAKLEARIGGAIRSVVPGTPDAARLKDALIEDGLWSQYLEVAIGPDAEIFTKTALLASVGSGAEIGVRSNSSWNNPEPEVVLAVNSSGQVRERPSAMTSTFATSKGEARFCSERPRTTTRHAPSDHSFACSTTASAWMMSARR